MPIPATPVIPSTTPSDQAQTGLVVVNPSSYYGTPLKAKRRGVLVAGGVGGTLRCQLLTQQCMPTDLTTFGFGLPQLPGAPQPRVLLRMREAVGGNSAPLQEMTANPLDYTSGLMEAALPGAITANPGVYDAEFGVYNQSGALAMTNRIYVWVDNGLYGQQGGLPPLDEVRLTIQDVDPSSNLLVDDFENDIADICLAAVAAVRMWNELQPPIDLMYTTNSYPFTQQWLNAVAAGLYVMRAKAFLRNHLPYQAAGVSVDDLNKWKEYLEVGQQMLQEYKEWVKLKKTQINAEGAYTSFGSEYYHMWP
jgi:hypothetical protein